MSTITVETKNKSIHELGWKFEHDEDFTQYRMVNADLGMETDWHYDPKGARDAARLLHSEHDESSAGVPVSDETERASPLAAPGNLNSLASAFIATAQVAALLAKINELHEQGAGTRKEENELRARCDTEAERLGLDKWDFMDEVEKLVDLQTGLRRDDAPAEEASPQPAADESVFSLTPPGATSTLSSQSSVLKQQMRPAKISTHPTLMMRAGGLDEGHVAELRVRLEAGMSLPAVDVFFDESENTYWLADGNHRHEAARPGGYLLDVNLHQGSLRDARRFAIGANAEHGLKRTDDDKRLQVVTLLTDPEWCKFSDTLVSNMACVTQPFVSSVRAHLGKLLPALAEDVDGEAEDEALASQSGAPIGLVRIVRHLHGEERAALTQNILSDDGVRVGRDGRVINTERIGKTKEEPAEPLPLFAPDTSATGEFAAENEPAATDSLATPTPIPRSADALLFVLKSAGTTGVATDELLRQGFTLEQIQTAQTAFRIERQTDGNCYYVWQSADVVDAIKTYGPRFRLQLEELGCGIAAITAAMQDGLIEKGAGGTYILAAQAQAQTPSDGAEAEQLDPAHKLREFLQSHSAGVGIEEMLAAGFTMFQVNEARRAEAIKRDENGTYYVGAAAPPPPDASAQSTASSAAPAQTETPRAQAERADTPPAATREQRQPSDMATIEQRLKGRKMIIGLTFIPGLAGKVQATVNVGDNVRAAARELFTIDELVLPPRVLRMIDAQLGGAKTASVAPATAAVEQRNEDAALPKVERILTALKGAKTGAEFDKLFKHYKLDNLTRFNAKDAASISALLKRLKKKFAAPPPAKGGSKAAAKKPAPRTPKSAGKATTSKTVKKSAAKKSRA